MRRVTTRGPHIYAYIPMNKENQLLVADDPVELRNKQLKFQVFTKFTHHSRGIPRIYPNFNKEKAKVINIVTGWTWKH